MTKFVPESMKPIEPEVEYYNDGKHLISRIKYPDYKSDPRYYYEEEYDDDDIDKYT